MYILLTLMAWSSFLASSQCLHYIAFCFNVYITLFAFTCSLYRSLSTALTSLLESLSKVSAGNANLGDKKPYGQNVIWYTLSYTISSLGVCYCKFLLWSTAWLHLSMLPAQRALCCGDRPCLRAVLHGGSTFSWACFFRHRERVTSMTVCVIP